MKTCTPRARILCSDNDCLYCPQRKFSNHPRSKNWSKKNEKSPGELSSGSARKFYFDCDVCGHEIKMSLSSINKGSWCKFCSGNELCDNVDCQFCFARSFASSSVSKNWSNKNSVTPRQVSLKTNIKYLFNCDVCSHVIISAPGRINDTLGCEYCANRKRCDNNVCKFCFEHSFASHPRAVNWSPRNTVNPRDVAKNSRNKQYFDCDVCGHELVISLSNVCHGTWCKFCSGNKLCDDNKCKFCFERSFANDPRSENWSDKNTLVPRQVAKCSEKKFYFHCDVCLHIIHLCPAAISQGNWCVYCANLKLCENNECKFCFEHSFASNPRSKNWSDKNKVTPRQVSIKTHTKYRLNCDICLHTVKTALNNLSDRFRCGYCANIKRCKDSLCKMCHEHSFASHERSKNWSPKNIITPREIALNDCDKYWFNCDKCHADFYMAPSSVNRGSWCPACKASKGETTIAKVLDELELEYKREKTFEDLKFIAKLRYDFYAKTNSHKCVIEFDGQQHFEQNSFFSENRELLQRRDAMKTLYCVSHNISLLRIAYSDIDEVEELVTWFIDSFVDLPVGKSYIKCSDDELYKPHLQKCTELAISYGWFCPVKKDD